MSAGQPQAAAASRPRRLLSEVKAAPGGIAARVVAGELEKRLAVSAFNSSI